MKRFVVLIVTLVALSGCNATEPLPPIEDPHTRETPLVLNEVPEGMMTIEYLLDSMGRSRSEYHVREDGQVIVDASAEAGEIQRGAILYFSTPEYPEDYSHINPISHQLARVVGLPGERIRVDEGQVYVNDRKLDTFYGIATWAGMREEDYIAFQQRQDASYTLPEDRVTYFNQSVKEVEVPPNHFYILVDRWWRGVDSRHYGPIPMEIVEGEVAGVTEMYPYPQDHEFRHSS